MTIEELKTKQRADQRQELLAIAYGNAPDNLRAEALELLRELDKQEERAAFFDTIREELEKAFADEPQQRIEQAKEAIKAVLLGGLQGHFDEFYNIVAETAKTKGRGNGKRAAAQMLLAAHSSGAVDRVQVESFAGWLEMWSPITGIKGDDDNYKECKIDEGRYRSADRFSENLRAIIYPDTKK